MPDSPRVLMFGWEFPPHNSGGLGTACFGICQAMNRQNVDLIFVLPRSQAVPSGQFQFVFAGLENIKFEAVNSPIFPYITSQLYAENSIREGNQIYGATLFDEVIAYGQKAASIAGSYSYDIIHAHDWLAFPAGLMAKKISGKPLIVHVHATEFDRGGGNAVNQQVYNIEKEGMEKADGIIAVSQRTKDMIVRHYGVESNKIKVVYNGSDTGETVLTSIKLKSLKQAGKKIILFLGRITLQKGPDYFIETANKVLARRTDVCFLIAGSGDMEYALIRQVAKLGLSDKILFVGFARDADLQALYQAADLYILPSVSEPFGLTPLEALSCGTPVLVSFQSGVSEVLSHALKADFWDTDEMANKIISLLDNPALASTLSQYGKEEAKKLTWDKSVLSYLDFYKKVLVGTY